MPTHRIAAPLITLAQAVAVSEAFNVSRAIPDVAFGCFAELNTVLTVRCSRDDDHPVDSAALIRAFFSRVADFMRYHHAPLAYVYVRESGREKGDHLHVAIYVPDALADRFLAKVEAWLADLLEDHPVSDALDVRPVSRWAGGLPGLLRYFIKEGDDEARAAYDVEHLRNGLPVYGKRLSISSALKCAVRMRNANVVPFPARRASTTADSRAALHPAPLSLVA